MFDELVAWSSSYFDFWHSAYPCLHAPSILQIFEKHAADKALDACELIIVKSIMSISLMDYRQSGRTQRMPEQLVFQTFDEALDSVQLSLFRTASILQLQGAVVVQIFLVSMLRLNTASRLGGVIVRMAYQLGLHRCPARFSGFSEHDRSQRRRLFESIYCLDRHMSHALGLPLMIRDDDIDVCHFDAELHNQKSVPLDSRLALLTFLTKLARIKGSIMELRNKNIEHRDSAVATPVILGTSLEQWSNHVDDFLTENAREETISQLHRAVLNVSRHEATIILHRPSLLPHTTDTKHEAGLQSCILASKAIISILSVLAHHDPRECPLIWPSFTWATWMSSFIISYGFLGGHVSIKTSLELTEQAATILQKLAVRGSVWPSACAAAIEHLRTALVDKSITSHVLSRQLGFATSPTQSDGSDIQPEQPDHRAVPAIRDSQELSQERSQRPRHASPTVPHPQPDQVTMNEALNWFSSDLPLGDPRFSSAHINDTSTVAVGTLGYRQQWRPDTVILPKGIPPYSLDTSDPLQGFDIPFWVDQDNFTSWGGGYDEDLDDDRRVECGS